MNITASASAGRASYDDNSKTFTLSAVNQIIAWAKLEHGNFATAFISPVPATELIKCQRYYQIRSASDIAATDLCPAMANTPAVTVLDNGNYAYCAE